VPEPILARCARCVDDTGQTGQAGWPFSAVELLGLQRMPTAGDEFEGLYADEKAARAVVVTGATWLGADSPAQADGFRRVSLVRCRAGSEGELKSQPSISKADDPGQR